MRTIMEFFQNIGKSVQNFIFSMYDQPLFWVVMFLGLLAIVMWGYSYLHKKDR